MDPMFAIAFAPGIILLAALLNGLLGRWYGGEVAGLTGAGASGLAFIVVLLGFFSFGGAEAEAVRVPLWDWLPGMPFGFAIDQLSLIFALVITSVGTLINIYSMGYMQHDDGRSRYFAGLNLFIAAMLVLVLADSFVLMFLGWEGVGVCSYLLIGFWYRDRINANAARKAFIVTRIGDVGFLLAMFMTWRTFGTLDIASVMQAAPLLAYGSGALTVIGVLYMLAAAGKSAQLPLHVWLPDAMAGPTPVSALIHAATMVTAGVYLVARSAPLFAHAPEASAVVAWIGALTALLAAFTAMAQTDIKKVLAWSTISQLGFMFVAVGSGAYWAGVFHVFTHAFFKALLFLASGSVIHALGGEQDLARMGGLGRRMKITGTTALIGTLAISGVPLLAGFFSKDAILLHTLTGELLLDFGPVALFAILLLTSVMTAFYMFRWYFRVFAGPTRLAEADYSRVHESPANMTVPLIILAFLSVTAGWIGLPQFLARNYFADWLNLPLASGATFSHLSLTAEWLLVLASVAAAAIGIGIGWFIYARDGGRIAARAGNSAVGTASREGLGIDAAYATVIVRPAGGIAQGAALMDTEVIDRSITGSVRRTGFLGRALVLLQSGYVRLYALLMLTGLALLGVLILIGGILG